jgi:hypothetical protein
LSIGRGGRMGGASGIGRGPGCGWRMSVAHNWLAAWPDGSGLRPKS